MDSKDNIKTETKIKQTKISSMIMNNELAEIDGDLEAFELFENGYFSTARTKWNAGADKYNQWDSLGQDERDELEEKESKIRVHPDVRLPSFKRG